MSDTTWYGPMHCPSRLLATTLSSNGIAGVSRKLAA
jgi:hypothetical protein